MALFFFVCVIVGLVTGLCIIALLFSFSFFLFWLFLNGFSAICNNFPPSIFFLLIFFSSVALLLYWWASCCFHSDSFVNDVFKLVLFLQFLIICLSRFSFLFLRHCFSSCFCCRHVFSLFRSVIDYFYIASFQSAIISRLFFYFSSVVLFLYWSIWCCFYT